MPRLLKSCVAKAPTALPTRALRLAATALALAATAAGAASPRSLPPGSLHVQPAEIVDRQGFERPMPAMTMMVPAGWQHQGQVAWTPPSPAGMGCARPYQPQLQARAPDGRSAIELIAGEGWGAASIPGGVPAGCAQAATADAPTYLRQWVQRHRPGARWLDYRARPDKSLAPTQTDMPGGGFLRSWLDTGQALVAYTQGGQEMRELLAVAIRFTQTQLPMPMGPAAEARFGESLGVLSWRAPAGQLDFKQFDAVWQTLRSHEPWRQRVAEGMNQMARDNRHTQDRISQIYRDTSRETLAHIAQRGEMAARTRAEIADIRDGTQRDRDATNDRMHTQNVRAVREVQAYRDPAGGVVELPHHYRHAWKLRDGSYLLTDNPSLGPGRDLGLPGQALQPAR